MGGASASTSAGGGEDQDASEDTTVQEHQYDQSAGLLEASEQTDVTPDLPPVSSTILNYFLFPLLNSFAKQI